MARYMWWQMREQGVLNLKASVVGRGDVAGCVCGIDHAAPWHWYVTVGVNTVAQGTTADVLMARVAVEREMAARCSAVQA